MKFVFKSSCSPLNGGITLDEIEEGHEVGGEDDECFLGLMKFRAIYTSFFARTSYFTFDA